MKSAIVINESISFFMQLNGNGNFELFLPLKISAIMLASIFDAWLVPSASMSIATSRLQRSSLIRLFSSAGYDKELAIDWIWNISKFIINLDQFTYQQFDLPIFLTNSGWLKAIRRKFHEVDCMMMFHHQKHIQ